MCTSIVLLLHQYIWQRMSTPLSGVSFTNEFLLISAAVGVLLIGLLAAFSENIGVMSETLGRINEVRLAILNEKIDVISADRHVNGNVSLVLTNYGTTDSKILAVIDADGNECPCTNSTITPDAPQELVCSIPNSLIHDNILVITGARNILDVKIHRLNGSVPDTVPLPSPCADPSISTSMSTSPENTQSPTVQPDPPNNLETLTVPTSMSSNPQTPKPSQTKRVTEPPKTEEFDTTGRTIDLYTGVTSKIRIDTHYFGDKGTRYHINDKAFITIFRDTEITSKSFVSQGNPYCYVGDLLVGPSPSISVQHDTTLHIQFRESDDPARCNGSPDIELADKLFLNKEVYVRFVDKIGKVPFYHYGDGNGSNLVEIDKCDNKNFNKKQNKLKRNAEICYGRDGNDILLVSKILATFGVK